MEKQFSQDVCCALKKIERASMKNEAVRNCIKSRKIINVKSLYDKAMQMLPEVDELCSIANKAIECGYCIVDSGGLCRSNPKGCPVLCTDGLNHRLGFFGDNMLKLGCGGYFFADFDVRYSKIGYKNGGCDGIFDFTAGEGDIKFGKISFAEYDPDFRVFNGMDYWTKGVEQLTKFTNGDFVLFKKQVYDFVNNIEKYRSFTITGTNKKIAQI